MTLATPATPDTPDTPAVPEGHVGLSIDGTAVTAPKGELLIRTCERLGIVVPRFCDHPLLEPAGACRQCLVEVELGGRPMPKPQASCTMTVAEGMVVRTQHSSPVAAKAQAGVMELLLINHPLDCPVCDKGGECPLQNQAMAHGRSESRFREQKRTFPKPIAISSQVLLDRERCVLCQRCTRFADQVAGDGVLQLLERGAHQQVGVADDRPFLSYFSGNTIQICPVGALTSAAYRFRSRPFDLVSTPGVCEHCASGCAQRTDWRRGEVQRRLARADGEVNEEWNCDKGRFAFRYLTDDDRITRPMVRGADGELTEASWTEALHVARAGLLAALDGAGAAVLPGGRLTVEDAYAYAKFARVALRTNDIDARARLGGDEELRFLARHRTGVTYADLEAAPAVVCVAFEPEEESPIVFLRLRKAARAGTWVGHLSAVRSPAVVKTGGHLLGCLPGDEAARLGSLTAEELDLLRADGAVLLVGERAAAVPGLYDTVTALAELTGARVAWVPRRAGEPGARHVGALPSVLPGGAGVDDADARAAVERAWGLDAGALPAEPGRDLDAILRAAVGGGLEALVLGGLEPADLPDPELARRALDSVFVISLELRRSEVTEHADVVLPVAPVTEKSGTYLNWEGRVRPFGTTLEGSAALADCRVLDTLAVEMDVDLFTQTPAASAGDLSRLLAALPGTPVSGANSAPSAPSGPVSAANSAPSAPGSPAPGANSAPNAPGTPAPGANSAPSAHAGEAGAGAGGVRVGQGQAVVATWRRLLDHGALQSGEDALAGTRREVTAVFSPATAARLGVVAGQDVALATADTAIRLTAALGDVLDDVVWLPAGPGSPPHGALVSVAHHGAGEPA